MPLSLLGIDNHDQAACSGCDEACYVPMSFDQYPPNFSIDTTTPLLGKLKPFDQLILCSTGKTNWPHDVCEDPKSISGALRRAYPKTKVEPKNAAPSGTQELPGILPLPNHLTDQSDRSHQSGPLQITILGSSHLSTSNNEEGHSLIVLPDWVRITDVTLSDLPKLGPNLKSINHENQTLKVESLPYGVLILICSHKTRDRRCSISAPLLEEALIQSMEALDDSEWWIDRRGDYDLNDLPSTDENDQRRERSVGLFKVSHSGGHKFAGNVIVNFSSGVSIWYGRVTPSDCKRIVEETLVSKKVIPELLKGGIGLNALGRCDRNLLW